LNSTPQLSHSQHHKFKESSSYCRRAWVREQPDTEVISFRFIEDPFVEVVYVVLDDYLRAVDVFKADVEVGVYEGADDV